MKEEMLRTMAQIMKLDEAALQQRFDDPAVWDSLLMVEVILALEEEYGVHFTPEQLPELRTPQKLCEAVLQAAQ